MSVMSGRERGEGVPEIKLPDSVKTTEDCEEHTDRNQLKGPKYKAQYV